MAELAAIKRKLGTLKGCMTRLVTFTSSINENTDVDALQTRLNRAKEILDDYSQLEIQLFRQKQDEESEFAEYEDQYYRVTTTLSKWIRHNSLKLGIAIQEAGNESFNNTQINPTIVKLPKLNIAKFDGQYSEWQTFYDAFSASVHENQNIAAVQKFIYLKGLLTGQAFNTIKHFKPTDSNYIEAFQKLCSKYDRKRYAVHEYIERFFNQPIIKEANSANVRSLYDTSDEVLRGLKAIGEQGESRDPWLIHILLGKLDSDTKERWAHESASNEFPTVEKFFEFLNKRIDALEVMRGAIKKRPELKSSVKVFVGTNNDASNCTVCHASPHLLYECNKFKELTMAKRVEIMKNEGRCFNCLNTNHTVYQCKSSRRCLKCKRKHHTLLHFEPSANQTKADSFSHQIQINEEPTVDKHQVFAITNHSSSINHLQPTVYQTLLPTAVVQVEDLSGNFQECRALLDSGSQVSLISENCARRLQLPIHQTKLRLCGLGETNVATAKGYMNIIIHPSDRRYSQLKMITYMTSKIASLVPNEEGKSESYQHLQCLQLADPGYNNPREIDMLIGAAHVFDILIDGKIYGDNNQPVAQNTIFGWVVAGPNKRLVEPCDKVTSMCAKVDIDHTLRQFWEFEEIVKPPHLSNEETLCESHFTETTIINENNRFVVRLPFKTPRIELGRSYHIPQRRLMAMEKKFSKNEAFYQQYRDFMREYESMGHMRRIEKSNLKPNCYILPHHGIIKEASSTTKLRVVFDASAKSSSGNSLNDALMVGPTIQPSLYNILLRFRQHRVAFTGDVEKMYRQIIIDERDVEYQTILWRENSSHDIQHYQLLTVTYGTSPAPFLATRVLMEIADRNAAIYPEASFILKNNMYVDDVMSGSEDIDSALQIKGQLSSMLEGHGLHLRKWTSNHKEFLSSIPDIDREMSPVHFDEHGSTIKVLGVQWYPSRDIFKFFVRLDETFLPTKRKLLSEASRIYDPMGWLSPVTIAIKILFQKKWLLKLDWDTQLPDDLREQWYTLRNSLIQLEQLEIPRWFQTTKHPVQIHGFADASEVAYAAVVYCRTESEDGDIKVTLITAKTKVAPLKQISIPKLELCAAHLLARLLENVKAGFTLNIEQVYAWTDSTIVLDWLSLHPRTLQTYVANRSSDILSILGRDYWHHVPSVSNPADCASRGLSPNQLINHHLWWTGPNWLEKNKSDWPFQKQNYETDLSCYLKKRHIQAFSYITTTNNDINELPSKYSSFHKICKILSIIKRVTNNMRTSKCLRTSGDISRDELFKASQYWVIYHQRDNFSKEIESLSKNQALHRKSKLQSLLPFIDRDGILRVGGRIRQSFVSHEVKHPAIICNSRITYLIAKELHEKYFHAGLTLMISTLMKKYWIIGAKHFIRKIIYNCVVCTRHRATTQNQLMGDLPPDRVQLNRPFLKVAVDYAGPVSIYLKRGRGQKSSKAYICIFVCMSTKAAHIETVSDLTSEAFIGAFRRMMSRRGAVTDVYRDNGTNFVGANNSLKGLFLYLKTNKNNIISCLSKEYFINWHFSAPGGSHLNGLVEAAVKSMKFHLRRVIGQTILTSEELYTGVVQIEAILNSRPICLLQPNQIDALTPGHFLIGHPIVQIPDIQYDPNTKLSTSSRWKLVQQIIQHIWRRYHSEYLASLQKRNKWQDKETNINVGDIVLIRDENLSPTHWAMGKVEQLQPGNDKLVRVVTLRIKSKKLLKRPIHKLVKLPVESIDSRESECSQPGRN